MMDGVLILVRGSDVGDKVDSSPFSESCYLSPGDKR